MRLLFLKKSKLFFIIMLSFISTFINTASGGKHYDITCNKEHCTIPFRMNHNSVRTIITANCKKVEDFIVTKSTDIPVSYFRWQPSKIRQKVERGTRCKMIKYGRASHVGWHKGGTAVTCYQNGFNTIECNRASPYKKTIHVTVRCKHFFRAEIKCDNHPA